MSVPDRRPVVEVLGHDLAALRKRDPQRFVREVVEALETEDHRWHLGPISGSLSYHHDREAIDAGATPIEHVMILSGSTHEVDWSPFTLRGTP